jgi:PAS domain S-box-containing protein
MNVRRILSLDADSSHLQTAELASESELRFREIIDALPAAIYTTDAEGRLTHFNPAAVKFSGRTPELGTDQWCITWKLFHADGTSMAHDECPMAVALKEGRIMEGVEAIAERPDGTRRWFTPFPTPLRDHTGKIVGGINMLLDITERKEAEQTRNLLAAIVGSSDDAIVSKNLDGVITSWNKGAERVFGYTAEEAVGQHITLVIPKELHAEEADILARLRRGERVDHFQTVRRRKDGTTLDVSLTISPLRDTSGRVVGASKVARDISVQKRAEETLRQSEEQFRRLSETLDLEVKARTRELEERNADVLRQSEQLRELSWRLLRIQDDERRRIARELHDSAGQTLTVLGMNLAQVAQKALTVAPTLTNSMQQAEELIQQLHQEIRTMSYLLHPPLLDETGLGAALTWYVEGLRSRSRLEVSLNVSEDLGRLPPDMELVIFRVVQECLTNIHRHSGSKTAFIEIVRTPDSITVEVRDQGKGIPAKKLAEIQSRGSGVGIRGMRERVHQLRGDLFIESNRSGTRVFVTIPIPAERLEKLQVQTDRLPAAV